MACLIEYKGIPFEFHWIEFLEYFFMLCILGYNRDYNTFYELCQWE